MDKSLKREQMDELIKLKLSGKISSEEANKRFAEIQNPIVSRYANKDRVLEIIKQCVTKNLENVEAIVDQRLSGEINVSFGLSEEDGYGLLVVFGDDRVVSEIAMPTTKTVSDFVDMEKLEAKHAEYIAELSKQKLASQEKTNGKVAESVIDKINVKSDKNSQIVKTKTHKR